MKSFFKFLAVSISIQFAADAYEAVEASSRCKEMLTTAELDSSSARFAELAAGLSESEKYSLMQAAVMLQSGGHPAIFSKEIRSALMALGDFKTVDELKDKAKLSRLIRQMLIYFEGVEIKNILGPIVQTAYLHSSPAYEVPRERDIQDMIRGFGSRLLPETDIAFSGPSYLLTWLSQARPTGEGFTKGFNVSDVEAEKIFERAWARVAPPNVPPPNAFALTGTQANNLLYEIARDVVQRRTGKKKPTNAELIHFQGAYAGAYGPISSKSAFRKEPDREYEIENPVSPIWNDLSKDLDARENAALKAIEEKILDPNSSVGGILIEPVPNISDGVLYYRAGFLFRLRILADKYEIPIIADEILTGGGRTGKFFAYQNYHGFHPDFVTFGKGMIVSGIAKVNRGMRFQDLVLKTGTSTLLHYSEILLKAARVMNRIAEGKLMQNASEVGPYFLQKLREKYITQGHTPEQAMENVRGIGLMFSIPDSLAKGGGMASSTANRLFPVLTLTKEDVDRILSP